MTGWNRPRTKVTQVGFVAIVALSGQVLGATVLGGCGFPVQDSARAVPPDDLPTALRPQNTADKTPGATSEPITVWFVRDGMLDRLRHRIVTPLEPRDVLADLLVGPTAAEQDRSFRSAIPDPSVFVDVQVAGGLATVELAAEFAEISIADQVLAVGQLVLTLTDLRGVGRVQFVVDGTQVAVPLPSGEASDETVSRDDYIELTEPAS